MGLSRVAGSVPVPVRRSGGGRVFRLAPARAGLSAARGRGGGVGAGRRPLGGGRLCRWRGFVRSLFRPWRCGVRGVCVWLRARGVRSAFRGPGARCGRWWPRFRSGRVPVRAVSCWAGAVRVVLGLLLRFGVGVVGFGGFRGGSGRARGRVPVRVFGVAGLGRLAARCPFRGLGARVPAGVIRAAVSAALRGGFLCEKIIAFA